MDPKFQTSFIPKKPIVANTSASASISSYSSGNIINFFSSALFITLLIVMGGLFGYKKFLTTQIANADVELTNAKEALQPNTINQLINASSRINAIKKLLNSHIAVTQLFSLLQSLTLKTVRLSNFSYKTEGAHFTVSSNVEAQSYNSLYLQSEVFLKNSFIKNPVFSDFDVTESGTIQAKFTAEIDPTVLSYRKAIEGLETAARTDTSAGASVNTTTP